MGAEWRRGVPGVIALRLNEGAGFRSRAEDRCSHHSLRLPSSEASQHFVVQVRHLGVAEWHLPW